MPYNQSEWNWLLLLKCKFIIFWMSDWLRMNFSRKFSIEIMQNWLFYNEKRILLLKVKFYNICTLSTNFTYLYFRFEDFFDFWFDFHFDIDFWTFSLTLSFTKIIFNVKVKFKVTVEIKSQCQIKILIVKDNNF